MKVLSCAAVRRRLQRAHDGELPVGQQIEVDAHLESCERCAEAMDDLDVVREAFRASVAVRTPCTTEDHTGFLASVVGRAGVERQASWPVWLRDALGETHLVYAGLGAVGATVVCLMIMSSMMGFAALVAPGSNLNPLVVDARMLMPRVIDNGFDPAMSARSDDETAFTLSAVVTKEGRLLNLELHPESGRFPVAGSREARAVENMLGAMARARFAPARVAGLPIAVNMIWLVEHTTVHAAAQPGLPAPVSRMKQEGRVERPAALGSPSESDA